MGLEQLGQHTGLSPAMLSKLERGKLFPMLPTLLQKVRQRGYRTVVQPASEVIHFEGASAGTSVTGTGVKRFQAINHRKFFERWKDTLAMHRFNGELPDLEAERSVRQRALFIDDSVPEPDKDAGSNAAFQHIQRSSSKICDGRVEQRHGR